jgi:hypothetical protein
LSDACETGMGRYDPITGKAWRYKFTTPQQQAFTLNTKDFLAAVISQQLTLRDNKSPYPCHISDPKRDCTIHGTIQHEQKSLQLFTTHTR